MGGAGASPSSANATPAAASDTAPEATATTTALHHMTGQSRCHLADVLAEPPEEALPGIHRRGRVVARSAVVEEGVIGARFDGDLMQQPAPPQGVGGLIFGRRDALVELSVEGQDRGLGS